MSNEQNLERGVEAFLANQSVISPHSIRALITSFRVMPMCDVPDDIAENIARKFEIRHGVTMALGATLRGDDYVPWLGSVVADIDFYYWNRYRKLLVQKQLSTQVIATIDEDTRACLELLENPAKSGPWQRRGMVMGHIQSGKTGNYIGLVCKAADAGYKLVIVIAGVHNNLRNQTQKRLDEGFVGRDSARLQSPGADGVIGVGRFDSTRRPWIFTTSVRDFSKVVATTIGGPLHNLPDPALFVVKKNSNTLKSLIEWLRETSSQRGGKTVDLPVLVVDDEADNASINVSHGAGDVSRINGQIRELLQMFPRACYVGYTATPFANIFIDPDTNDEMLGQDLFPRDFILSLDPPTNYFGANRVFAEGSGAIRYIEDNEELLPIKHKIDHRVDLLPPSLLEAIRTFVLARAARIARGETHFHCSMLVNASRFTEVQRQLRNAIQTYLHDIQSAVLVHGSLPPKSALRNQTLSQLKDSWDREYGEVPLEWATIQTLLHQAAASLKVVEVNSRSSGALNYGDHAETGLGVIAVGGYSLSRGLTLEGLVVSYFLRNSMMYDTLMQMGRWFGYRDGYDDLCRIWMPEETEGWYSHIAESIEMLRAELRRMAAAGATPEQFGLRVRAHPSALIVTARNKMGSGERVVVNIGLANEFIETTILKRDQTSRDVNRASAVELVSAIAHGPNPLTHAKTVTGGYLFREVPVAPIKAYLAKFINHPLSLITDPGPVTRYIEEREGDELATWDVLVAGIAEGKDTLAFDLLGTFINCQRRSQGDRSDTTTIRVTNKQRVASRGIEKTGLDEEAVKLAEAQYKPDGGQVKDANYPDRIYRAKRNKPLLILHLLNVLEKRGGSALFDEPVAAWSISFPGTERPERLASYIVNTTWLREHFREEMEDTEMDSDDE